VAALVYFKKESEQPGFIRYSFGADPAEMERQLSLNTATRSSEPAARNGQRGFEVFDAEPGQPVTVLDHDHSGGRVGQNPVETS
jgi:hypothetical protein